MPTMPGRGDVREAQMTATEPSSTPQPVVPDTKTALIVYILYFVGYFTGITAMIGAIVARVQVDSAEPLLATHYRFQIRTFWIGLLYLVVGVSLIVIGAGVLVWWTGPSSTPQPIVLSTTIEHTVYILYFVCCFWSLIRNIKGVQALNEHRPIADPGSW